MSPSISHFVNRIICGDARQVLSELPDESIDCVVTSPPYWSLRDYGSKEQVGLEATFEEYIARLSSVFDEVKRVLKSEGTCWVVLGDTYSTRNDRSGEWSSYLKTKRTDNPRSGPSVKRPWARLPGKCLIEIPSRFAIEMMSRGWILRNEIIWHKPNCMPSSARDRFTVDFEKVFFFVKSRRYYFEQQFEELRDKQRSDRRYFYSGGKRKRAYGDEFISVINPKTAEVSRLKALKTGRNKRSVWTVATRPFAGDHFAVYPPALIETPIRAGCPAGGIVLDPFIGSGTTALVARKLGRRFIGIELNPRYVEMAKEQLAKKAR